MLLVLLAVRGCPPLEANSTSAPVHTLSGLAVPQSGGAFVQRGRCHRGAVDQSATALRYHDNAPRLRQQSLRDLAAPGTTVWLWQRSDLSPHTVFDPAVQQRVPTLNGEQSRFLTVHKREVPLLDKLPPNFAAYFIHSVLHTIRSAHLNVLKSAAEPSICLSFIPHSCARRRLVLHRLQAGVALSLGTDLARPSSLFLKLRRKVSMPTLPCKQLQE